MVLRELLRIEQDRTNRLTEALAQKTGIDLVMPRVRPEPEPAPNPSNSAAPFWRANMGGHTIATPVKEVPAPDKTSPSPKETHK